MSNMPESGLCEAPARRYKVPMSNSGCIGRDLTDEPGHVEDQTLSCFPLGFSAIALVDVNLVRLCEMNAHQIAAKTTSSAKRLTLGAQGLATVLTVPIALGAILTWFQSEGG
jgi:hypothetical protein